MSFRRDMYLICGFGFGPSSMSIIFALTSSSRAHLLNLLASARRWLALIKQVSSSNSGSSVNRRFTTPSDFMKASSHRRVDKNCLTVFAAFAVALLFCGCASPYQAKPLPDSSSWSFVNESSADEYSRFSTNGDAVVSGQAFVTQRGGFVVKGAGAVVNLDPVTKVSSEWWSKQVEFWNSIPPDYTLTNAEHYKHAKTRQMWTVLIPPSNDFKNARRTTRADADGRFRFSNLPPGKYFVTTTVSWMVGYSYQGGLVGQVVDVGSGEHEVMLSHRPR